MHIVYEGTKFQHRPQFSQISRQFGQLRVKKKKKRCQTHEVTRHHNGKQVELRCGGNRSSKILEVPDTQYKINLFTVFKEIKKKLDTV